MPTQPTTMATPAAPSAKSLLRRLIESQQRLSRAFDRLLPAEYAVDGCRNYRETMIGNYIATDQTIYDVGAGKNPLLDVETKRARRLRIVGLDIDAQELARAPAGVYDRAIPADLTTFKGEGDADLVLSQSLLEHVRDTDAALGAVASILKPGGTALLFVPSRNAWYARLNLLLPEGLKRRILYAVYPQTRRGQGFVSYYHRCTPRDFEAMARAHGMEVVERRLYFRSGYFSFFFPLYFLWRLWVLGFRAVAGDQAAETFAYALRKRG